MTSADGPREPTRFGSWLKGTSLAEPVPGHSLAWLCQKEGSAEEALVELHFGGAGLGLQLRDAVAANAALTGLGAEPLIQTDRLILRSGEGWTDPPGGTFQYWVAREVSKDRLAEPVTSEILRHGAESFQNLAAAVGATRLTFSPAPHDFSLASDGSIRVARIGLPVSSQDLAPDATLLTFLRQQTLDPSAKDTLDRASSIQDLLATSTAQVPAAQTSAKKDAASDLETLIDDRIQQPGRKEAPQQPVPPAHVNDHPATPTSEPDITPGQKARPPVAPQERRPAARVRPPSRSTPATSGDPKTDRLCADLSHLGVPAQIADQNWAKTNLPDWLQDHHAVIEIQEGPIRWARFLSDENLNSDDEPSSTYGVPDPRITSPFPEVEVRSVRARDFPVFGKVFNVSWEGRDGGFGLLTNLNTDAFVRRPVQVLGDLLITAQANDACWQITDPNGGQPPSLELWNLYQDLARHLLALPLPAASGPVTRPSDEVSDRKSLEPRVTEPEIVPSDALARFDRAIARDPNDAEAYYNRANEYQDLGHPQRAISDYGRVIEIDPKDADAFYNRATLHDLLGNREQAIADYNQAVLLEPNDALALYNRGALHHAMGQDQSAIADLGAALTATEDPGLAGEIQALLRQIQ